MKPWTAVCQSLAPALYESEVAAFVLYAKHNLGVVRIRSYPKVPPAGWWLRRDADSLRAEQRANAAPRGE